jgi:hypothetical protein
MRDQFLLPQTTTDNSYDMPGMSSVPRINSLNKRAETGSPPTQPELSMREEASCFASGFTTSRRNCTGIGVAWKNERVPELLWEIRRDKLCEIPVLLLRTIPSISTRLIVASLNTLPLIVLSPQPPRMRRLKEINNECGAQFFHAR